MQNHNPKKHPRGSSPPSEQVEMEFYDHKGVSTLIEETPDYSQGTHTRKESSILSALPEDQAAADRWRDDGGESGEAV